jgi:hypothetical protein
MLLGSLYSQGTYGSRKLRFQLRRRRNPNPSLKWHVYVNNNLCVFKLLFINHVTKSGRGSGNRRFPDLTTIVIRHSVPCYIICISPFSFITNGCCAVIVT